MAQKKVILKDGGNDLLPKTLASMVFTEAGQTVEEALQNAGGGSSSGGGTGNVNVTNGSSLQKDAYYTFRPSAAESLTGKFETIPYASGTVSGLMLPSDYNKLAAIRKTIDLPSGLKDLTAESTDEQVFDVFGEMLNSMGAKISTDYPGNKIGVGYLGCLVFSMILSGDESYNFQFALDKNPVSASFEVQAPDDASGQQYPIKGSASFTYVTSGRLRTTTLTATLNSSGDTATYDFKAKVVESGDDTYYLPSDVMLLKSGATKAEIDEAFGGEGKFGEALTAGINKKKTYIYDANIGIIPVSSWSLSAVLGRISFMFDMTGNNGPQVKSTDGSKVSVIYLKGYSLRPSLYSLTTASSSDDISTAVGGESGLKEIIQAVKDGNRLVIRGELDGFPDFSTDIPLKSVLYQEGENGDLMIAFCYEIFGIMSYSTYYMVIQYAKSSNTFTVLSRGMKSFI